MSVPRRDIRGRCAECGSLLHINDWDVPDAPGEEVAEVVRDGKHVLVHVSCMREGEEIA